MKFTDASIKIADTTDVPELVNLLNTAYRGESSKRGWTTEAGLIDGEVRTDETSLLKLINKQGSVMLKFCNNDNKIVGCVNLQIQENKVYLGMFSVSPALQGAGIGKRILKMAEEYALCNYIPVIFMVVISVRKELIDWYLRHGYTDTGKKIPFDEDGLSGNHLQPLEFCVLEKSLKQ